MAVTINPSTVVNTTLSDGDLTVTANADNATGYATQGYNSGKYYFECYADFLSSNNTQFGAISASDEFDGGVAGSAIGFLFVAGSQVAYFQGLRTDFTAGFAIDFGNSLFWMTRDVTAPDWNAGTTGTQDPSTGQGGVSFTSLSGPTLYPGYSLASDTESFTFAFLSASFVGTVPTGFSPWDDGGAAPFVPMLDTRRNRTYLRR